MACRARSRAAYRERFFKWFGLQARHSYRKIHILLIGVVAARKTHRVALSQESNPGLADRWQAQIITATTPKVITVDDGPCFPNSPTPV
jgi:hypothetical protein